MQIGVYGTGYLGTVAAACLADFGTPVTVFDEDSSRVAALAEGNTPFYERNLKDILRRNLRAARLTYSIDLASFAQKSQIIFFAADSYRYIEEISEQIHAIAGLGVELVMLQHFLLDDSEALELLGREVLPAVA